MVSPLEFVSYRRWSSHIDPPIKLVLAWLKVNALNFFRAQKQSSLARGPILSFTFCGLTERLTPLESWPVSNHNLQEGDNLPADFFPARATGRNSEDAISLEKKDKLLIIQSSLWRVIVQSLNSLWTVSKQSLNSLWKLFEQSIEFLIFLSVIFEYEFNYSSGFIIAFLTIHLKNMGKWVFGNLLVLIEFDFYQLK